MIAYVLLNLLLETFGKNCIEKFSICDFTETELSLQEECQNYIRVLLVNKNTIFTCGTNAFTPVCTNRTVITINSVFTMWYYNVYLIKYNIN